MAVFQNGPTGQLVVFRVGMDSNYVIETVQVLLQHMEEKVAKAKISQMCETVRQQNAIQKVNKLIIRTDLTQEWVSG